MKDGHIRLLVVVIENGWTDRPRVEIFESNHFLFLIETLVAKEQHNAERTFNEGKWTAIWKKLREESGLDFEKMVPPLVKQNRPAYYFVRLDTISEISGHNWLLIVYIPDDAKVAFIETCSSIWSFPSLL